MTLMLLPMHSLRVVLVLMSSIADEAACLLFSFVMEYESLKYFYALKFVYFDNYQYAMPFRSVGPTDVITPRFSLSHCISQTGL
jgi:hypothetical protein